MGHLEILFKHLENKYNRFLCIICFAKKLYVMLNQPKTVVKLVYCCNTIKYFKTFKDNLNGLKTPKSRWLTLTGKF